MIKWYSCIGLLLLISCSSKQEIETINLDDILPQSSYSKDTISIVEDTTDLIAISDFRKSIIDVVEDTSILFANSQVFQKMFPDRLTHVSREQELITIGADSILITAWEFVDSLTTINAFYNWLDCFGENCLEMNIGDEVRFSSKSVLTMVSNHHLIYLESSTGFDANKWQKHFLPLLYPDDNWIFSIVQLARRKGKWEMYAQ